MKRFIKFALLLTLALGSVGCGITEETETAVTYEMAEPRLLDGERQEILRVPVEVDCKAMLHYTYTTEDADGAVLWLENDGETLLMDELAAATDESYETLWQVGQITLRAGDNMFSLSAPAEEQVSCQMTLKLDEMEPDNLETEQMDPAVLNVD